MSGSMGRAWYGPGSCSPTGFGVEAEIHHGEPDVEFVETNEVTDRFVEHLAGTHSSMQEQCGRMWFRLLTNATWTPPFAL
jgi:hypothetical protein